MASLVWSGIIPIATLWIVMAGAASAEPSYPSNPLITATEVFLSDNGISSYRKNDASLRWQALGDRHSDDPVISAELLLVGSSTGLYAFHRDDGELAWRLKTPVRVFSPTVAGDFVYLPSTNGLLTKLGLADGRVIWQRQLPGWIYPPALADGVLVVGGNEHQVLGLSPADGRTQWRIALDQELVYRPVAVDDRTVVVTTFAGEILALAANDGTPLWRARDSVANLSPVVTADTLFFRTLGGDLRARRRSDGSLLWSAEVEGIASQPPVIAGDRVLVLDANQRTHRFDINTGKPLATADTGSVRSYGGFTVIVTDKVSNGRQLAANLAKEKP